MCYHANPLKAVYVRMCSPEAGAISGVLWGYFWLPRNQAIPPTVGVGANTYDNALITPLISASPFIRPIAE